MISWVTVCVVTKMTFVLLLATGSCGNEKSDRTGSTLSDMLWINQNVMYQELEDCSDSERYFYSTVFSSGICKDGKKWIYKQLSNRTPVSCILGYVLQKGSCVKECVRISNTMENIPLNINSTEQQVTDLWNITMDETNRTMGNETDLDQRGINSTSTNTTGGNETDSERTGVKETIPTEECIDGCYGSFCQTNCLCENNSTCDKLTGQCMCRDGWTGRYCEKECPKGTYGTLCSKTCACDVTSCHPIDGCICRTPGQNCNIVCPLMTFGASCSGKCLCLSVGTQECGLLDGSCTCRPGWTGTFCEHLCPFGRFGEGCQQSCECEPDEYCIPTNGECLCWNIITESNCTKDEHTTNMPPPSTAFPQTLLHVCILVGGGLLIIIAIVCTIVAWRRKGSQSKPEYKFNSKDSTLKIVHADLPPREDLSRYREDHDSNNRTQSCKIRRKSNQESNTRQASVLNLPSRVLSKPPSSVLGFQQYSPTGEGSIDFEELSRHSYVNLSDEGISKHVEGAGDDYERLNRDEIQAPFQDYEVCVKSGGPYQNVPPKKRRSILGSLRKLVRKESQPESDRVGLHLSEDTSEGGINTIRFSTFKKRYS